MLDATACRIGFHSPSRRAARAWPLFAIFTKEAEQAAEKAGVEQAHVLEAMEFNRAWSANVDEFEGRAAAMVQELLRRGGVITGGERTIEPSIHVREQR